MLKRENLINPTDIRQALIVEDHADARVWLRAAIESAFPEAAIREAGTLAEARSQLPQAPVDVLLVDLGLPDGSGIELIAEINAAEQSPLVIVTTIFDDDRNLFAALRAGAQGYVLKDESKNKLATMLADIAGGQPPLSPAIARRLLTHFSDTSIEPPPSETVKLTEREREVLTLLAKGFSVKRVADMLGITTNTTAGYVKTIYRKLNVSSRAEATLEAARRGLVNP